MNNTYSLYYAVEYDADSPIQKEDSVANINADTFEEAYAKASSLADELRSSPNVQNVVLRTLTESAKVIYRRER